MPKSSNGLARAVRPEEAKDLACRYTEGKLVERRDGAIPTPQPVEFKLQLKRRHE